MKSNTDHEKLFFNYFLTKPEYLKSTRDGFFKNSDLDDLAKIAKNFFLRFGECPSRDQMIALSKDADFEISEDIINTIYDVNLKEYDQEWLRKTGEAWVTWKHFDKQLIKTVEYVKTQQVNPENVQEVVSRAISMISSDGAINFDTDVGLDFFDVNSHIQETGKKIKSGWDFIDNATNGGYDPKTLVVYAGEQNVGKSIWLANDAANFITMGHNVVFITAEMSPTKVVKRIGSNLLNISMEDYDTFAMKRDTMRSKLERISNRFPPPGKLFVKSLPTSQGTVLDIESYLKSLEESTDVKINVVIIDYINILANYRNPNTENTYMKIKQIAEDLRALAQKRDVLVISATQINRGAWDSTEIKMENIAESAGLAHTVDVMYGIIQDALMHTNRVYWLKILKIRDGIGKGLKGEFEIDYSHMRLKGTGNITQATI